MKLANKMKEKNIWAKYNSLNPKDKKNKALSKDNDDQIKELRQMFDEKRELEKIVEV